MAVDAARRQLATTAAVELLRRVAIPVAEATEEGRTVHRAAAIVVAAGVIEGVAGAAEVIKVAEAAAADLRVATPGIRFPIFKTQSARRNEHLALFVFISSPRKSFFSRVE